MCTFSIVKTKRLGSEKNMERDRTIKKLWDDGAQQTWIADHFNMTQQRVYKIIIREKQNERNGYK